MGMQEEADQELDYAGYWIITMIIILIIAIIYVITHSLGFI
jgi:hypothetical protein